MLCDNQAGLAEFFQHWEMSAGRKAAAVRKAPARSAPEVSGQGDLFGAMPQDVPAPLEKPAAEGEFGMAVSRAELQAQPASCGD